MPASAMGVMVAPLWDDLIATAAGNGIYTAITGSAPNRIFYVEYRTAFFTGGGAANFEVAFHENGQQVSFLYGTLANDSTSATIGVQGGGTGPRREFSCNTSGNAPSGREVDYNPTTDYANNVMRAQSLIPGTTDIGLHADDGVVAISLPFAMSVYGTSYSNVNVSSNGNLQFDSTSSSFSNTALPASGFGRTLFPFWDDQYTVDTANGQGVFTAVTGTAPNRQFVIEFRTQFCCAGGPPVNDYEVVLNETSNEIDYIYGALGSDTSATVGVQSTGTGPAEQFSFNTTGTDPPGPRSSTCPSAGHRHRRHHRRLHRHRLHRRRHHLRHHRRTSSTTSTTTRRTSTSPRRTSRRHSTGSTATRRTTSASPAARTGASTRSTSTANTATGRGRQRASTSTSTWTTAVCRARSWRIGSGSRTPARTATR